MKIALAQQMRNIDKIATEEYGIPELSLMESAGRCVFMALEKIIGNVQRKTVCILAGSGNNGGDALTAARYLSNAGAFVKIFLIGNREHRTNSFNIQLKILRTMGIELNQLDTDRTWERLQVALRFSDAIIDGILGTGLSGEIRPSVIKLIRLANNRKKPIVAVDIPSGIISDTGEINEVAINASCTVSLGLPKIGYYICPGASQVGKIVFDDLGLPSELLRENIHQTLIDNELAQNLLPMRSKDSHKGTCGKILIIAGSLGMTGAACLAALSALRVGAGLVTLVAPESLNSIYEVKLTEVMTTTLKEIKQGIIGGEKATRQLLKLAEEYDAVLLGPGLGREPETVELVRELVRNLDKPLVLDADAIYPFNGKIEEFKFCKQIPIITPHLGELSALLDSSIEKLRSNLVDEIRRISQEYRVILVAKCETTIIGYPNGEIFISPLGNSGMASGGSGDVLAGAISGLMKQTPFAPLAAVWIHGRAGDIAAASKAEGLIATDIVENLPFAIKEIHSMSNSNN